MEVHADGNVSSCKFFPEFVVGQPVRDRDDRAVAEPGVPPGPVDPVDHGMMPVCSKCILLYLNGV